MTLATLGTAHLYGLVHNTESTKLLRTAIDVGFRRFDTAPSYGHGDVEPALGRLLQATEATTAGLGMTAVTKVGIHAAPRRSGPMALVAGAAHRLPSAWVRRLRSSSGPADHGHFGTSDVHASITESLRRLGHLERLMLHEVYADQITDELLTCLVGYQANGDVDQLGVATANDRTAACVAVAPDVLTAVHLDVGPLAGAVTLPPTVTTRVGHGILGPAGRDLRALQARLHSDPHLRKRWQDVTGGTPAGLADVLLTKASTSQLTELIVATSRPARLPVMLDLIANGTPLSPPLAGLLTDLCANLRRPES